MKNIAKDLGVADQIHILKNLSHEEVFKLLDKIDIYVQPSKQEGLPRALIEAMSRACPAIGTFTGGIPELLSDKYLYKAGNVSDLAFILQKLTKSDLIIMAKKNFEKSRYYLPEILDAKRKTFYNEILKIINLK